MIIQLNTPTYYYRLKPKIFYKFRYFSLIKWKLLLFYETIKNKQLDKGLIWIPQIEVELISCSDGKIKQSDYIQTLD